MRGFWPQQGSLFWVCPAPVSPCKDRLVALCPQAEGTCGAGRFLPQPPGYRQAQLQNLQGPMQMKMQGSLLLFQNFRMVAAE